MKRTAQLKRTVTGWAADLEVCRPTGEVKKVARVEAKEEYMADILLVMGQWVDDGIILLDEGVGYGEGEYEAVELRSAAACGGSGSGTRRRRRGAAVH